MPTYQIVIHDAEMAHAQEIRRNVEANIATLLQERR